MKCDRRSMYQLLSAAALACLLPTSALAADDNHDIVVLSNRADLISGGDALVELNRAAAHPSLRSGGMSRIQASLTACRRTICSRFAPMGGICGLVKGLNVGDEPSDRAGTRQGAPKSSSPITPSADRYSPARRCSHGSARRPPLSPESGNIPASNASGLTTVALDSQCNIATEYKLFYRTTTPGCSNALPDPSPPTPAPTNNCFKPYTLGSTPADLAMTTTTTGLTVPYIVRVERGTINRGIYDIAVLFDTTQMQPWTPVAPQAQWNRKVVYTFGASTGQPRLQFRSEQNWADDSALSRGFMVVDNSLTDSLYNSNRIVVAETLMMMKENIVDQLRRNRVHAGQWLLRRLDPAEHGRFDVPRPARWYPAELRLPRLDHDWPGGLGLRFAGELLRGPGMDRADDRPDPGADQCQENGDQRPSRPSRLPVVEQLLRVQQQAGQLRPDAGDRPDDRCDSADRRPAQQLSACLPRWSTTR